MTVTEQVESVSRDVEELRDLDRAAARALILRKLSNILRNLAALTDGAFKLYQAASVLAPETADIAVEIWGQLYKNFAFASTVLERIQNVEPGVDELVEKSREIFRGLVEKSALAILEWDAEAEADRGNPIEQEDSGTFVPNAETLAAIEEGKRGDLKSFNTVAELMADLNAED